MKPAYLCLLLIAACILSYLLFFCNNKSRSYPIEDFRNADVLPNPIDKTKVTAKSKEDVNEENIVLANSTNPWTDKKLNTFDEMSYAPIKEAEKSENITRTNWESEYDAKSLLPQEENDWFDPIPNPLSYEGDDALKNIVPIVRNIPVNTVGSSRKNASLDFRDKIPIKKITLGPWNQSSFDPEIPTRGILGSSA